MTTAEKLLNQFGQDLESNLDLLSTNSINTIDDWDAGVTEFNFRDNSSIRFDYSGFICDTDNQTIIINI